MPNPFSRFGVTDADIAKALAESAEVDAGLNEFMENEVVPYARSQAPVDTGEYAAGIKVTKKARGGKGVVSATHWRSHLIEDGTGGDTPTQEHAVMGKTAAHFGGTLDRGISEQ